MGPATAVELSLILVRPGTYMRFRQLWSITDHRAVVVQGPVSPGVFETAGGRVVVCVVTSEDTGLLKGAPILKTYMYR